MSDSNDQELAEIKQKTLAQLRAARSAMLKLDYLLALKALPAQEQREAALQLNRLQLAYLQLRRARLDEIADLLKENAAELKEGIAALQSRLDKTGNVQDILKGIKGLLRIVGRIVELKLIGG